MRSKIYHVWLYQRHLVAMILTFNEMLALLCQRKRMGNTNSIIHMRGEKESNIKAYLGISMDWMSASEITGWCTVER